MATLAVDASDYSVTKQKALEDAKAMQASMMKECADAHQNPPPYEFLELIGKGSFGRVYKATAMDTKPEQLVAIKVINIEEGDSLYPGATDTFSDILKEINALKLLSKIRAKNINTVIDAVLVGQSMWMVTEYCAGGSVASLMRPTGGLPEKWIIPILREVAEAMYWVHKEGIVHRDIKCANVLVTDTGDVQLCDFGVAGIIETKFDKRNTITGTLQWMAPELFDSAVSYGTEVDIWAFGSMAYEVASGLPPNATGITDISRFGDYLRQHCPRLEGDQYSSQLKDFVSHCMVVDPAQRPPINTVQKHPYISNTSDDYPTKSLSALVNAYKLWEMQGGSRRSLFSGGGAQGPTDDDSSVPHEEWNFTTMDDSGRLIIDEADAEAVYDVYHPRINLASPTSHSRRGRRRPAIIKAPTAPLEKAFDPNTISNYKDSVRTFYGRPYPTSESDLPLRDDSNNLTLRESLIDLDAALDGSELSRFADMETIKARTQPLSSDEADLDRRRTQDWTFPAIASASTNLEMPQIDGNNPPMNPNHLYLASDASASYSENKMAPSAASGRIPTLSLIDLDASLMGSLEDTASTSSNFCDTPSDIEPLTSKIPAYTREPSIYVPDEAYLHGLPENTESSLNSPMSRALLEPSTEVLTLSLPKPPSQNVMQGISSRDEVKGELRHMISSFSEHLEFTANWLNTLPVRRAGNYSTEKSS
ncbi:kinase-like protein [Xylaria sp. FL0933]|nr:kinase-like protein [Xylaria sp. FL0933]